MNVQSLEKAQARPKNDRSFLAAVKSTAFWTNDLVPAQKRTWALLAPCVLFWMTHREEVTPTQSILV